MAKWDLDKLSKKGKKMTKYTRADILDTAKQYVTKQRENEHGEMEANFKMIGDLWGTYLERKINPSDVAVMMTLLKIARIKSNPSSGDNWIDSCGYMACGGELSANKPELEVKAVKFQGGNV